MKCPHCGTELRMLRIRVIDKHEGTLVVECGMVKYQDSHSEMAVTIRCPTCGKKLDGDVEEMLGVEVAE